MTSHYLYSFLESHLQPFLRVVVVLIAIQHLPSAHHGIILPLFHSTTFFIFSSLYLYMCSRFFIAFLCTTFNFFMGQWFLELLIKLWPHNENISHACTCSLIKYSQLPRLFPSSIWHHATLIHSNSPLSTLSLGRCFLEKLPTFSLFSSWTSRYMYFFLWHHDTFIPFYVFPSSHHGTFICVPCFLFSFLVPHF